MMITNTETFASISKNHIFYVALNANILSSTTFCRHTQFVGLQIPVFIVVHRSRAHFLVGLTIGKIGRLHFHFVQDAIDISHDVIAQKSLAMLGVCVSAHFLLQSYSLGISFLTCTVE